MYDSLLTGCLRGLIVPPPSELYKLQCRSSCGVNCTALSSALRIAPLNEGAKKGEAGGVSFRLSQPLTHRWHPSCGAEHVTAQTPELCICLLIHAGTLPGARSSEGPTGSTSLCLLEMWLTSGTLCTST